MDLVIPGEGLIVWSTIVFLILLFLLSKFAWKPILASLSERDRKISDALDLAEKTKKEMQEMQAQNEQMLQEARIEREKILKEAKEMKDQIISQARKSAEDEGRKSIASAKEAIEKEKVQAMMQLKNTAAQISVEIAEKILRKKIESTPEQEALINDYITNLKLN
jgi:F-type H+-transporting ATPase subunit b